MQSPWLFCNASGAKRVDRSSLNKYPGGHLSTYERTRACMPHFGKRLILDFIIVAGAESGRGGAANPSDLASSIAPHQYCEREALFQL